MGVGGSKLPARSSLVAGVSAAAAPSLVLTGVSPKARPFVNLLNQVPSLDAACIGARLSLFA